MARYILSPKADRDLRQAWRDIATYNEPAADGLIERLFDKFDLASGFPGMGAPRPELSPTARLLIEGNYIAIYEPLPDGILVVAVVYSRRDPRTWLNDSP